MSNVDFNEVDKFAALASRWWDKNSEFKPLHDINPLRLNYIKKQCGGSLKGKKILDVGCGGGILAESLAKEGALVTGIDMAEAGLEVAKLHLLESGLTVDYQKIPVEDFAKDNAQTFDVVTCLEMLEHVPDPASIINACATLVKANGSLFFSTLNRNTKSYLFAIIGAEYILKLLPQGTHDWDKFIQPSEMDEWARHSNLTLKNIIGMTYNPFTKTYKLESDVSVNYLCFYQK
ncbi:3-demethylubiquinol 3-O-methyltransferase (EC 2.1.1.64) @ 2-polyprenyl-6-hydroxyphenyl methylase (EC 2.1.1.222) [uncultured Gammaproteobacteria bacterium]|jgi:2-polyprenyl-6-hydroxyphenyl methylase/3-demethylubiquinone-9 3-methyltransferase|uniref:bifunctional 2-polyprenyl-6-hydroxyphenol methylase/3-demethylubiquinol 3-O-methyltransferase UbiG n=1 Tax=Bathymodiolus heckerae thiotrophic gill symbiont TaxID=1052212 RepID=UPI0010BBEDBD|nr:bifunctional 2-polyprenyl-6-hydroxyphenol methylase/3-demethylubiquinol 3-O-methyltransferase UbiG [Bathymodiolus heckerae thiotrophic gill symbiont]CAC9561159.1 3-demethylubiquinol 3-O-methyltransferase (EC 2.1.1.64) @ 2-polyprenyl-6-hydroxyphenyl methylase (EC 2.1.1.222) [uncultured Gammaproteobacteria bacterium]CAC9949857.1 3-demethylubiquinol 3-O-methyltransferase (EC 2.1.1.64) @ 2-polyprenyl-6-hydroxyphenyl methylase (EC 2.1.1.222) [uncultured Gammaproteobacteria bacterium]SMN14107.1 3-d